MKTFWISKAFKLAGIAAATAMISSCIATNNMYVNNPVPLHKEEADLYVAISSGMEAQLDSSLSGSSYVTDYKTQMAPVLSIGGQIGITEQFNLRAALHLPYGLGGFGFRVGGQYSLFNANRAFNAAIGTDLGLTFSRDSIFSVALDTETRGMHNIDAFLPMSYSLTEDLSLIITPRYSFTWISVDDIHNENEAKIFSLQYPILTVGLQVKGLYLESSVFFAKENIVPQFGLGFTFEL